MPSRSIANRCSTALLCTSLALAVAVAPTQAQASTPTGMSPTAAKLRTIMSLQDADVAPADVAPAAVAPPADAPVAQGPPPPVGPAPAPAPVGPPPRKGLGMMITGAVITGAYALPFIGWGAYVIAVTDPNDDVGGIGTLAGVALVTMGLIGLSVGAPLLGVGAYRFSKYQKWKNGQVSLQPSMNRTMHGTYTAGLSLRF